MSLAELLLPFSSPVAQQLLLRSSAAAAAAPLSLRAVHLIGEILELSLDVNPKP